MLNCIVKVIVGQPACIDIVVPMRRLIFLSALSNSSMIFCLMQSKKRDKMMEAIKNVQLGIKTLSEEEASARFTDAWESGEYAGESLTFESLGSFFEVFNSRRWGIVV